MKQPRLYPSRQLPPVKKPGGKLPPSSTGRNINWVEGYAGTARKSLSTHELTAYLASVGAPVVLARPLPTVAVMVATNQLTSNTWVTAGTVEVHGCRYVNFHVQNVDENENGLLARPFRIIESNRFVDDFEDPYIVFDGFEVRIPVVCDCEVVGLEVMDFVVGQHALYNVGVGMTP